jgi:hypothetical protein
MIALAAQMISSWRIPADGFFVTFGEVVSGFPCLFEDVDFIRH